jgi:hypothetical protein
MLSPRKPGRGSCRLIRRGGIDGRIVLDVVRIVATCLPSIPGWAEKSRIRHGDCSRAGGVVATYVVVVALNALSVSR